MAGTDILDDPPLEIAAELVDLATELDASIPAKVVDRNLVIGTWNIRNLGNAIHEWRPAWDDRRGRKDLHALRCMAEIISRFDLIAIQEVKGDAGALHEIMRVLGSHWSIVLTDVNQGRVGNQERLAFLFDTRKVLPSGLACELVLSDDQMERAGTAQFARSPYAAGFRIRGGESLTVVTTHAIWGSERSQRVREVQAFAEWLRRWARDDKHWAPNVIAAGEFQVEKAGDATYQAFTATGLRVPKDILNARQLVREFDRLYQLIAWFEADIEVAPLPIRYQRGGAFDFSEIALAGLGLDLHRYSFAMSDHLPLWAEFSTRS